MGLTQGMEAKTGLTRVRHTLNKRLQGKGNKKPKIKMLGKQI
jgi:hypothetical protein